MGKVETKKSKKSKKKWIFFGAIIAVLYIIGANNPKEYKTWKEIMDERSTKSSQSENAPQKEQENETPKESTTEEAKKEEPIVFISGTKAKNIFEKIKTSGKMAPFSEATSPIAGDIVEYSAMDARYSLEVGANKNTDEVSYITITSLSSDVDVTESHKSIVEDLNLKDSNKLSDFIKSIYSKPDNETIEIDHILVSTWSNKTTGGQILSIKTDGMDSYLMSQF